MNKNGEGYLKKDQSKKSNNTRTTQVLSPDKERMNEVMREEQAF